MSVNTLDARAFSVARTSDVPFESTHASLEFDHLHVEGGLLAAESSDLLLEARILLLLLREVTLDVLLYLEKFVGQRLSHVLSLKCQVLL